METVKTTGVAFIEVDAATAEAPQVRVTEKVTALIKVATWLVHNNVDTPVRVAVGNFRPASPPGVGESFEPVQGGCIALTSNPTEPIQNGHHAVIVLRFAGFAKGTYEYDVFVNEFKALDPQLEI